MFKKFFNLFRGKKKEVSKVIVISRKSKQVAPTNEWVPQQTSASPEELCGIDPVTMTRETIRKNLAVLYKRHNAAVSSLNPQLRQEAAMMLEAIVACRERYVDES